MEEKENGVDKVKNKKWAWKRREKGRRPEGNGKGSGRMNPHW